MKLENIIENHINAIGGFRIFNELRSLQTEFHLVEPTFEVDGIYIAERSGQMRVDIFSNNVRVFSEGLNNSEGWQLPQDAKVSTPTSSDGTRALLHGIENHLFGLHELSLRGHHLELMDKEIIGDIDYLVIRITYSDNHSISRYINPANWLVELSRENRALHPDIDPTETVIETQYSDFRKVNNLLKPFYEKTINLTTNDTIQTTMVKQLTVNPSIDPNIFKRP